MERVPDMAKLKEIELDVMQVEELLKVGANKDLLFDEVISFIVLLGSQLYLVDLPGEIDKRVSYLLCMREQRNNADIKGYLSTTLDFIIALIKGYITNSNII